MSQQDGVILQGQRPAQILHQISNCLLDISLKQLSKPFLLPSERKRRSVQLCSLLDLLVERDIEFHNQRQLLCVKQMRIGELPRLLE